MTQKTVLLPSAVIAMMLAAVVAAPAQTDTNNARGSVTAIDATAKTITVKGWGDAATPTTFKVNDETKYMVAAQGALTDIKVGQQVRVMGGPAADAATDNEIDARMIMIGGPTGGGGGGHHGGGGGGGGGFTPTMGTVLTVPPDMTVTTKTGTVTVDTSDDTRVMSFKTGALTDVKTGTMVMANLSNGIATSVRVMPGFGGHGQHGGWSRNGHGGSGGDGAPSGGGGGSPTQ